MLIVAAKMIKSDEEFCGKTPALDIKDASSTHLHLKQLSVSHITARKDL